MALQVTTAVFNPLLYGVAVQLKKKNVLPIFNFFLFFTQITLKKSMHREIEAVVEMDSLDNGLVSFNCFVGMV